MRCRFGIAELSAKKSSSLSAGVLLSNVSALSPRSETQSGSPTGATVASPSRAPRSTIVRKRGSRPSARASFGRYAQANRVPEASSNSRRDGACSLVMIYVRRNSGAISRRGSAGARFPARAPAWRFRADAGGRTPASTSATGSNRSATTPAKLLAMSTRCDRPSIHADSSSAKPFGASGRHSRSPSNACPDMTRPTTHGAPVRRSADMIHSDGRLSFVRCGIHASSAVTSAFATSLRSPSLSLKFFFKLGDQGGRRLVGHEMPRELLGDVPRCRRMAREIGKRGAALIDASVGIALAKHDLLARLMKTLEENKFSAVAGRAYVEEGPAGEHIRKTRDIGLRIAAADAERVQFENLAGEVLVQTLVTIDAGDRIRAHRFRVIEVGQHGRMAFDRGQHVSKGAEDVRAYRLALIGAG